MRFNEFNRHCACNTKKRRRRRGIPLTTKKRSGPSRIVPQTSAKSPKSSRLRTNGSWPNVLARNVLRREQLNQRYLSLKKGIPQSHRRWIWSGWFGFRENIMRGYVRMRAETEGINLGRHDNTAGNGVERRMQNIRCATHQATTFFLPQSLFGVTLSAFSGVLTRPPNLKPH